IMTLMLGMAWLNLRQARAALANGHLEEAQRLLAEPAVQGHQKSWKLLEELADRGEFALARQMFERVPRVVAAGQAVERFRTELERRGIKFTELLPAL